MTVILVVEESDDVTEYDITGYKTLLLFKTLECNLIKYL